MYGRWPELRCSIPESDIAGGSFDRLSELFLFEAVGAEIARLLDVWITIWLHSIALLKLLTEWRTAV